MWKISPWVCSHQSIGSLREQGNWMHIWISMVASDLLAHSTVRDPDLSNSHLRWRSSLFACLASPRQTTWNTTSVKRSLEVSRRSLTVSGHLRSGRHEDHLWVRQRPFFSTKREVLKLFEAAIPFQCLWSGRKCFECLQCLKLFELRTWPGNLVAMLDKSGHFHWQWAQKYHLAQLPLAECQKKTHKKWDMRYILCLSLCINYTYSVMVSFAHRKATPPRTQRGQRGRWNCCPARETLECTFAIEISPNKIRSTRFAKILMVWLHWLITQADGRWPDVYRTK